MSLESKNKFMLKYQIAGGKLVEQEYPSYKEAHDARLKAMADLDKINAAISKANLELQESNKGKEKKDQKAKTIKKAYSRHPALSEVVPPPPPKETKKPAA